MYVRFVLRAMAGTLAGLLAASASATSAEDLQAKLEARLKGDRTGACAVAALIDQGRVVRAKSCAKARAGSEPGFDSVFEIGSVSKTMTAFLVADLVVRGEWSLDDPIAKHLPPDTPVPRQGERQILVRDVLTHTSGLPVLPPGFSPKNPTDPYADLSQSALLAALGKVRLSRPIGSQFEYSNFAMMLMSLAVARSFGDDYEGALVERLFAPLKMDGAYVERQRHQRPVAEGHLPSGRTASDWHFAKNLAGVGGVRATLEDMVLYAQAGLGQADAALLKALKLTQQPLREGMGMNWMLSQAKGHGLVMHSGGTGGFTALVMLEPEAQRAVVILVDTSLTDLGGLGPLGLAILGIDGPPVRPRLAQTPSDALMAAMSGDYSLGSMSARIWRDGTRLWAQPQGQAAFELKYDSWGDFYPEDFSALLTPHFSDGKVNRATWRQGGGSVEVTRQGAQTAPTAKDPRWKDLAGEYALAPQFSLRVFEENGELKIQGSGQPSIAAELTGTDTVEVKRVGAVIAFKRDETGRVTHAVLRQGGQVLEGRRKP